MMCRLGIVGLEDEVISHVYLEFGEVFHTGLESSNNMEYFMVRVEAVGRRAITTCGQRERPKKLGAQ
jgi:hypothetical protein